MQVIYQQPNHGIKYEYSIPVGQSPSILGHGPLGGTSDALQPPSSPASLVHAQQPVYIPPQADRYPTVQSHSAEEPGSQSSPVYVNSEEQGRLSSNRKPTYQNSPAAIAQPPQQPYAGRGRHAGYRGATSSQHRRPIYIPPLPQTPAELTHPQVIKPLFHTSNDNKTGQNTASLRGKPGTYVNPDDAAQLHNLQPVVIYSFYTIYLKRALLKLLLWLHYCLICHSLLHLFFNFEHNCYKFSYLSAMCIFINNCFFVFWIYGISISFYIKETYNSIFLFYEDISPYN